MMVRLCEAGEGQIRDRNALERAASNLSLSVKNDS